MRDLSKNDFSTVDNVKEVTEETRVLNQAYIDLANHYIQTMYYNVDKVG